MKYQYFEYVKINISIIKKNAYFNKSENQYEAWNETLKSNIFNSENMKYNKVPGEKNQQ